jgi:mono/diheme cytochrome c family protein
MAKSDWNGLLAVLGGDPWRENEELRLTFLTAAHRELGHKSDATEVWRLAVIAAGQDARRIRRLLSMVESWRWREERYSLIWELFNIAPSDVTLRDELMVYEYSRGQTANLNKIYARLMQIAGSNQLIRNNFAYSSLLLDTNVASAHLHARAVFLESPQDPTFKTTYGFALYKQGQVQQAWDIMEGLALRDRPVPARILLHALYSAKLGKSLLAQDLLNGLDMSTLLPEERQLVDVTRREITRSDDTRGKETRLAELDAGSASAAQGGWIELLPSKGPNNPLVDMRLANSLYAKGDYEALGETLSARRWEEWEHVRVALLARVERSRVSGSAGVGLWRQAVVLAGIKASSLRDLEALARAWDWKDERMDVVARLYERDPGDETMLEELISYYRPRGKTHEIARLLWLRLGGAGASGANGKAADAPRCVYYSFLSQVEVSAAHTLAQRCHEDAPGGGASGVYGLSLWLQGRRDEAWTVLKDLPPEDNAGVSIALIQAMVLTDLNRPTEALAKVAQVDLAAALPEETAWAERVRSKAASAIKPSP